MRWGVAVLAAVLVSGCFDDKPAAPIRPRIDGSLVRLSVDSTAMPFEWSPDGKTLAYIVGSELRLAMPGTRIGLPPSSKEDPEPFHSVRWRADGKKILCSRPGESVLVDPENGEVEDHFTDGLERWFVGNKLCRMRPDGAGNGKPLIWWMEDKKLSLPAGLELHSISQDGRAFVLRGSKHSQLVVVDDQGRVRWSKELLEGTVGHRRLDLQWNPEQEVLVRQKRSGRPGEFSAVLDWAAGSQPLRLVPGSNANDFFAGHPARWIDDKQLVLQLDFTHTYKLDALSTRTISNKRIALYDAGTKRIRPVYESGSMRGVRASADYVAILEEHSGRYQLVISEWEKDEKGRIVSAKYRPDDAPEEIDWGAYIEDDGRKRPRGTSATKAPGPTPD